MQYNPTNFYQPNGILRFGGSWRGSLPTRVKSLEGSARADPANRAELSAQTLYGGYIQMIGTGVTTSP